MPRRSYAGYTRIAGHLAWSLTSRTLCGSTTPRASLCRDCADWAYPQDPNRNR